MPHQTQGRLAGAQPVAVLDIGSNSIRLVVYERLARSLTTIYNEKSSSQLSRGLAATGRLSESSMEDALAAIRRFSKLRELTGAVELDAFATSAVREASNGREFARQVGDIIGTEVRILSGSEEGRFAALGLVSGQPDFRGTVGDLGGGSLELADIGGSVEGGETFELGVIRLQDLSDMSPRRAQELARETLERSQLVKLPGPRQFAAVGGTWRALAMLHQERSGYPLHMVQAYEVPAREMLRLCFELVKRTESGKKIDGMNTVSGSRRGVLPYGAAVLAALLELGDFSTVVFSALGVREGYMFDRLGEQEQAQDPLLVACREISQLRSRSGQFPAELFAGSSALLELLGVEESDCERRLRHAACLVSDIGWRAHPDYRGEQSIGMAAFADLTGIDHSGRAFLAQTLAYRYLGLGTQGSHKRIFKLAGKRLTARARLLAAWFRLAYPLAASTPGVLPRLEFRVEGRRLLLRLPAGLAVLDSDYVQGRMESLAREAGFRSGRLSVT